MNLFSRRNRRDYDDEGYSEGPGMHQHGGHGMIGNNQQGAFNSPGNQGYNQNSGFAQNTMGGNHHQQGWTNDNNTGGIVGSHHGQHNSGVAPGIGGGHQNMSDSIGHNKPGHNTLGTNTAGDTLGHNTTGTHTGGNIIGHNTGNQYNEPLGQGTGTGMNNNNLVHNRSNTALNNNTNGYTNGYNQGMTGTHHHGNNNFNQGYDNYNTTDRHYNKHHKGRHSHSRSRSRSRGGFLSRRRNHPRNTNRNTTATTNSRSHRSPFSIEHGTFNRRPSFGQWLKFIWLDLLTMAAMGAVGLGVYNADPAASRSFPVTFSQGSGDVVFPTIAYPLRDEIIPIWAAALMASLIPIFIILCMQIRVRSFWDVNNAILGLLYSLIAAAVFQVFLKWLIGGLRPHFLAVCDPDPQEINAARGGGVVSGEQGNGFEGLMFDRRVCRGSRKAVNDALESFPSGHSTAGFAGFVFLYFYLNAKLKVWGNYHPAFWKLIATYTPILGATLIAGAMTIDEYHHWYDVLAGGIIGTVMAASAYRMVYASIWDFRFNHIPLTRHTPFSFGAGAAGAGGFEAAVFTRQAGWGTEEAFGGAPFDAAYHLRGQVNGFNTQVHNHNHSHDKLGKEGALTHDRETKHGLGHGHHGHNNTLGHNHNNDGFRQGDVEHHAGAGMTEPTIHKHERRRTLDPNAQQDGDFGHRGDGVHHDGSGVTTNRDEALGDSDGYVSGSGSNRYRQHRKSTERKALGPNV